MANSQRTPWRRIIAEGAAIVVSILLAFSIDAWWELRAERELEREYLASLQTEVEVAFSEFEADLQSRHRLRSMLVRYLTDEDLDKDFIFELLQRATIVNNLSPPTSVMDDLVSSGRLQLIRSADIRAGIMLHRQMMEKNELNEQGHRTFVNTRLIPFLSDRVPLTGILRAAPKGGPRVLSDVEYEALKADERFQNIMIERLQQLDRGLPRVEATTQHLKELSEQLSAVTQ